MLSTAIQTIADAAESDAIAIDGEPCGAVHRWVRGNVKCRPAQEFWIVFLLTAELADREARRQGYRDQIDRAASRTFAKLSPLL